MNGITCEFEGFLCVSSFANDRDIHGYHFTNPAAEVLGQDKVMKRPEPEMGSEDFAWYTREIQRRLFFFGVKNEGRKD